MCSVLDARKKLSYGFGHHVLTIQGKPELFVVFFPQILYAVSFQAQFCSAQSNETG